MLKSFEQ